MINKNYPFCVTIRIWLTLKDYQLNYIDTETDIGVIFFSISWFYYTGDLSFNIRNLIDEFYTLLLK